MLSTFAKFIIPILLVLPLATDLAFGGPSVSTLWKARGLEATETIDKLSAELDKKPEDKKLRCESLLEVAFILHASTPEIVHKQDDLKRDYYHIVLNEGKSLFDLIYIYDEDGELIATRIDSLPPKWQVMSSQLNSDMMTLIIPDTCYILFNLNDPFNPVVYPGK